MPRCLGCDATNSAGALICERCGCRMGLECTHCEVGNPPLAKFCCGCGARLTTEGSAPPVSLDRVERRQMTVLFCDLVGSTRLSRALDPEDWHALVNHLHSRCGDIIGKHYGHVAQYLGDGLLAYFGYPVAAQDDPRR